MGQDELRAVGAEIAEDEEIDVQRAWAVARSPAATGGKLEGLGLGEERFGAEKTGGKAGYGLCEDDGRIQIIRLVDRGKGGAAIEGGHRKRAEPPSQLTDGEGQELFARSDVAPQSEGHDLGRAL